ncbi:MAG: hypothetical protein LBJ61_00370, partial [Deltaproteobacteria bacterium]|nr:hypothetical protein [Deltaproteobacteria bacterium]
LMNLLFKFTYGNGLTIPPAGVTLGRAREGAFGGRVGFNRAMVFGPKGPEIPVPRRFFAPKVWDGTKSGTSIWQLYTGQAINSNGFVRPGPGVGSRPF